MLNNEEIVQNLSQRLEEINNNFNITYQNLQTLFSQKEIIENRINELNVMLNKLSGSASELIELYKNITGSEYTFKNNQNLSENG
jgi:chaperonin cofactor prefoldin